MRSITTLALGAAMLMVLAVGCNTSEPGVKNTLGNLSTVVNASPSETTAAAENVLRELELLRVHAEATELDGKAFGYTGRTGRCRCRSRRKTRRPRGSASGSGGRATSIWAWR